MIRIRARRVDSAHLLAVIAIVLSISAPAGAALVTARGIATNAIQTRHIKNGQVRSADMAPRSVTNRQLGIGAVKGNNLATGSIGAVQVADSTLTGAELLDGSVTAADLAPGTVGAAALGAGSIGSSLLATGAVGSSAIADGSVATTDIAPGAVTGAKVATGAIGEAEIGAGAVDSIELAAGAVQSSHLSADSVGGAALGELVGASVTATSVSVADDPLDLDLAIEEGDGHVVSFATEAWDTSSSWDIGAPTDLVIPSDGAYVVEAWVSWESDNDGYREVQVVHGTAIAAQDRRPAGSGAIASRSNQLVSTTIVADEGDVVRLRVSHSAGAALTADRLRLTVRRIGTVA